MTASAAHLLLLGAALSCLVCAAAIDVRTRVIPNELVLGVMAAGIALRVVDNGTAALWSVVIAAITFVPLAILAHRNLIGGGDAKMIAASVLLVDPMRALQLLTAIALTGGVLALAYLPREYIIRSRALRQGIAGALPVDAALTVARSESGLPYGLAILVGAAVTICLQP